MKNTDENTIVFEASDQQDDIISHLQQLAETKDYVFRGFSEQKELLPKIIREKASCADDEEAMLEDFQKYGSNYYHVSSSIDFLSYAQHFGIPTRLLDFTYNPFIALYFALFYCNDCLCT